MVICTLCSQLDHVCYKGISSRESVVWTLNQNLDWHSINNPVDTVKTRLTLDQHLDQHSINRWSTVGDQSVVKCWLSGVSEKFIWLSDSVDGLVLKLACHTVNFSKIGQHIAYSLNCANLSVSKCTFQNVHSIIAC